MPLCDPCGSGARHHKQSRLSESLRKIARNLTEARKSGQQAQDQLESWQRRWQARKSQIAQRLDLIDRQLDLLAQAAPPRPQLSLVGLPTDDDDDQNLDALDFEGAVLRAFDQQP